MDEGPVAEAPVPTEEAPVVDRADHIEMLPHSQPDELETEEPVNILRILLKRWYIVLATFVVFSAIGVPVIWYLVEPGYIVAGLIHVAPAQEDLLSGDTEQGFEGDYDLFKTTQAMRMTSTSVLENVASELVSRPLTLFKEKSENSVTKLRRLIGLQMEGDDPLDHLKSLVRFGIIRADPIRHSQFVKVSMKSMKANEAKIVVDSIMQN